MRRRARLGRLTEQFGASLARRQSLHPNKIIRAVLPFGPAVQHLSSQPHRQWQLSVLCPHAEADAWGGRGWLLLCRNHRCRATTKDRAAMPTAPLPHTLRVRRVCSPSSSWSESACGGLAFPDARLDLVPDTETPFRVSCRGSTRCRSDSGHCVPLHQVTCEVRLPLPGLKYSTVSMNTFRDPLRNPLLRGACLSL